MRQLYGTKPKKKTKKIYKKENLTFGTAKNKWADYVKAEKDEICVDFSTDIEYFLEEMEETGDWETLKEKSYLAAPLLLDLLRISMENEQWEVWKKTPIAKLDKSIADIMYRYANERPFKDMYSLLYASALSHFIDYVNSKLLHCSWTDNLYEAKKATLWVIHRYEFEDDYEDEEDFVRMFRETFDENFEQKD